MVTLYFSDEQYCSLEDVQEVIPDAWHLPPLGTYMDKEGRVMARPPHNIDLRIESLSQLLLDNVEGYE